MILNELKQTRKHFVYLPGSKYFFKFTDKIKYNYFRIHTKK